MSTTDREYARGKAERKRRLQQRQTLFFGSIILVLVMFLLISWLQWNGMIPSPFEREFTSEPGPQISERIACPADGTVQIAANEISAVVLNSTPTGGLAGHVAEALADSGVQIQQIGNWEYSVVSAPGVIEVGPEGHAAGFSLQMLLPGFPVMEVDREGTEATVIIGTQFQSVGDPAGLQPGQPVPIPGECANRPATTEEPAGAEEPTGADEPAGAEEPTDAEAASEA
ncbi:MAG TPA: LytR C-terminal domain-containing protein [Actinomycetaceae bacterium]|nr:LytR C-terminal domain-containing protein [Actinomycetaceae bacterium]